MSRSTFNIYSETIPLENKTEIYITKYFYPKINVYTKKDIFNDFYEYIYIYIYIFVCVCVYVCVHVLNIEIGVVCDFYPYLFVFVCLFRGLRWSSAALNCCITTPGYSENRQALH